MCGSILLRQEVPEGGLETSQGILQGPGGSTGLSLGGDVMRPTLGWAFVGLPPCILKLESGTKKKAGK